MLPEKEVIMRQGKDTVAVVATCLIATACIAGLIGYAYGVGSVALRQEAVTEFPDPGPDKDYYLLPDDVRFLTPCATEDSGNCYWDAEVMGNGTGTSFINLDGVLYFPEMR